MAGPGAGTDGGPEPTPEPAGSEGPVVPAGPPPEPAAPREGARSGADVLAERMAAERRTGRSPRPTESDRELFYSLLSYHLGRGTLDAEEFSERWQRVHDAGSLAELYQVTGDLSFPPPLADLSARTAGTRRRRRWFA